MAVPPLRQYRPHLPLLLQTDAEHDWHIPIAPQVVFSTPVVQKSEQEALLLQTSAQTGGPGSSGSSPGRSSGGSQNPPGQFIASRLRSSTGRPVHETKSSMQSIRWRMPQAVCNRQAARKCAHRLAPGRAVRTDERAVSRSSR
jgi:hypothetical protein